MQTNKIKNKRIFLPGGAGFVGSYIVEELLKYSPEKIFIIDNLVRGSYENMQSFHNNPIVEFEEQDIRNEKIINKYMALSDYCFHLAALRINACAANPREGFEVMVKSTFEIADSAKRHNIKKLIYSSSASVYGLAQHFPTPESDNPYDNQTFYGAAKIFGEQLLRSYYHMFGLQYVSLRYFNVYGPRMDTDGKYTEVMIKWLDCIAQNSPPLIYGDGSTSMDFVYVKDIAKANVLALLSDKCDTAYNIGCGVETSLSELLNLLLKVNNSTLKPGYREESSINPVSKRCADITRARDELGYAPETDLETGLQLLSQWYNKNNNEHA
ncbi:MAG: NAD-dependent epimerase/dehydratase family protein [Fibrobacteria bacterium]|nr:NAD-dependent epimerase/dehydratase family protein [Fibrobacteria bacterium]